MNEHHNNLINGGVGHRHTVRINSRKFDGSLHRSWDAKLVRETSEFWHFVGEFLDTVHHRELGTIDAGTVSHEYYWKRKWVSVFRFGTPAGDLRNFYCNVNLPPEYDGEQLNYIDLDVDVLINADGSVQILDSEEFRLNIATFSYSESLINGVIDALAEIKTLVETGSFPFEELPLIEFPPFPTILRDIHDKNSSENT